MLHFTFTFRTKCFHSRKIVLLFLFCSPCQTKVILCQRLFLKREPLQYIMSDILKARKNFAQALSSICTTALVAEISLILNFSGKPTCHQGWRIEIDSHVSVTTIRRSEDNGAWRTGWLLGVWGCEEEAFVISFPPTTHRGSKVYQANPQRLQKHNKLHVPPL